MASCDLINRFISELEPENLPMEFLRSAVIKNESGDPITLEGDELEKLIRHHPSYANIEDAKIYINVKRLMNSINLEVEYIYHQVEQRFQQENIDE